MACKFTKTTEKFEPFSMSTFGDSKFYISICDCENEKNVLIGCNKVHPIPH
jgi:hypothetical protein